MIRGIIFDLGNTLMSFQGDWTVVTAQSVARLVDFLNREGIMPPDSFAADFISRRKAGRRIAAQTDVEYTATRSLVETLAAHGFGDQPDELIRRALVEFFTPEQVHWINCPDAVATLAQLKELGLKLGAVSNATDDPLIQRLVAKDGLAEYLDPIISSAAMPWRKPDPRILQYVLRLWNLEPNEAVMVGDWRETDILAAHRAGMKAILIDQDLPEDPHLPAAPPDAHLLEPDAVIHNLGELFDAYRRLN